MIQWIQNRQWLPSVLLAASSFLIFGGGDFAANGPSALIGSAILAIALIFVGRVFYLSIALVAADFVVSVLLNLGLTLGSLSLALLVFIAATNRRRAVRISVFLTAIANLFGLLFFKNPSNSAFDSQLVFWLCVALILVGTGASYFLGRLTFTRIEHVGTSLDKNVASRESARLALRLAEQEERFQIAREISEVILQEITAVLSQAEGGVYASRIDASAATRVLERITQNARSAHRELRRLYDQLNRNLGIQAAPPGIDDLSQQIVQLREIGFSASLTHSGQRFEISEGASLAIYRLVFDALENVRDHAPAGASVSVDFTWVEDGMQVLIKDNGTEVLNRSSQAKAASAAETIDTSYNVQDDLDALVKPIVGPSITAMRERAALYGGAVEVSKVPGVGFTVSAIFPQLRIVASPNPER